MSFAKKTRTLAVLAAGFFIGAVVAYFLVMRYESAQSRAFYYVGSRHYDDGQIDLSVALLNRAVGKDSTRSGPLQLLGRIYSTKGNIDLALDAYTEALQNLDAKENRIDYYITLCAIANLQLRKGNNEKAATTYLKVLDEFPEIEQFITAYLRTSAEKSQRSDNEKQTEALYKQFIAELAEVKARRSKT